MKTLVVVQSRLDSTRLPQKALLPLAGIASLAWSLRCAKPVNADNYVLATDENSYNAYIEIANAAKFDLFAGEKDDVLNRFCSVIKKYSADFVLRITGDNPFICFEAANESLVQINKLNCDYFTYSGLPHGSGVEVFNAKSLLKANKLTNSAYDHEHVGPALYLHKEKWNYPNLRTTIDTPDDYNIAKKRATFLIENKFNKENYLSLKEFFLEKPFTFDEIINSCKNIVEKTSNIKRENIK